METSVIFILFTHFDKVLHQDTQPLRELMPKPKVTEYDLRNKYSYWLKVNKNQAKNFNFNHLVLKYNLALQLL